MHRTMVRHNSGMQKIKLLKLCYCTVHTVTYYYTSKTIKNIIPFKQLVMVAAPN